MKLTKQQQADLNRANKAAAEAVCRATLMRLEAAADTGGDAELYDLINYVFGPAPKGGR